MGVCGRVERAILIMIMLKMIPPTRNSHFWKARQQTAPFRK
ncbi:hypothetical protein NC652_016048 [Populus alba x Populus x berolinensis]|nr:hypothetical protein NC652_016048 [Populus alba x Populus x berolinensis]